MRTVSFLIAAALMAALPFGNAARADAIDGNWCDANGKNLSIDGPNIRTPGGIRMQGDYSRHAFSYVASTRDFGSPGMVMMVLMDEDTMTLKLGEAGKEQVWKRCAFTM